jgi:hypothetical protein
MTEPASHARRRAPGGILALGGAALVLALFLAWGIREEALFLARETANGLDVTPDGYLVFVAGIVAALAAGAWFAPLGRRVRRLACLAAAAAGLGAVVIGVYDIATLESRVLDEAARVQAHEQDIPEDDARRGLAQLIEVTIGPGLYLAVAGGALTIAGGALGARGRRSPAAPVTQ